MENKCPLCGKVNPPAEWACEACGAQLPASAQRRSVRTPIQRPAPRQEESISQEKSRGDDLLKLIATAVGISALLFFFTALSSGSGLSSGLQFLFFGGIGCGIFGAFIYGIVRLFKGGQNREKTLVKVFFATIVGLFLLVYFISQLTYSRISTTDPVPVSVSPPVSSPPLTSSFPVVAPTPVTSIAEPPSPIDSEPVLAPTPAASTQGEVWVNSRSGIYHFRGTRWYGNTSDGYYSTEAAAKAAGHRAAQNGQ